MTPKKKNYTAIALSLLAMAAAILLGLWPLLILITPVLLIFILCRTAEKKPAPAMTADQTPALPAPAANEHSVLTMAFGVLQNRITEAVRCCYPSARWTWANGNAREQFAAGRPLTVMLNGTGGYRKARVLVHELQFQGLAYLPMNPAVPDEPDADDSDPFSEPEPEEDAADYGLLAFEWVEANAQLLDTLGSDAAAQNRDSFRIPAEELLHGDSWPAICTELVRGGFAVAEVLADGIRVQIKTEPVGV